MTSIAYPFATILIVLAVFYAIVRIAEGWSWSKPLVALCALVLTAAFVAEFAGL